MTVRRRAEERKEEKDRPRAELMSSAINSDLIF